MTEQSFKNKVSQAIAKASPSIDYDLLDRISNDIYLWFIEHQREMTEAEFDEILRKHGVIE